MNNDLKLLSNIAISPVIADFYEDLNNDKQFKREIKILTQNIIAQIRRLDELLMKDATPEMSEQQINIQLAYRQWLRTAQHTDEK
jgi:hypothetical protein